MAATYDAGDRPRGIQLLRDALDAAAGTGRLGEGMREGWAGRVLDLVASLGPSLGHDVNVADCLLSGVPMLYCLDGFDDPGMSPLFASVILRQVVRATNVPKAQRGFTRVMVDELALFGAKQLAHAMRVWRGRRVQFVGASQLASDFPQEIHGHIGIWFLGQQSGGEAAGRRWASDVTFGIVPSENWGEHSMPRGTYQLVANGRTQQVKVPYWRPRPPAPSFPLPFPSLPALPEPRDAALPRPPAFPSTVTPQSRREAQTVSTKPKCISDSVKPSVTAPPSWVRAQGDRGITVWARLWHGGDPERCWLADTSLNGDGKYAKFSVGGTTGGAHRIVAGWFLNGRGAELKPWLTLDHQCHLGRAKRCCNPAHLEEITGEENKQRSAMVMAGKPIQYGASIAGSSGGQRRRCDYEPVVAAIEERLEQQRQERFSRRRESSSLREPLRLPQRHSA
jgi:hypothetical protein